MLDRHRRFLGALGTLHQNPEFRILAADRIFKAVDAALNAGARTPDLGGKLTTRQMGDAILKQL